VVRYTFPDEVRLSAVSLGHFERFLLFPPFTSFRDAMPGTFALPIVRRVYTRPTRVPHIRLLPFTAP
jgi:hypothetical protein